MEAEFDIEAALDRADAGDLAPVGRVLEGFRPRLARMIDLRMHPLVRGRLDVHDVLQEAFVEIVERIREYTAEREVTFYVWVRFLVGQRLSQLHRRHLGAQARDVRRERPVVPEASSIAIASAFLDPGPTPSRQAIGGERRRALEEGLEQLKPLDREVLALRHFEELSNREVAQTLRIADSAASVRYVRALERLRGLLGGLGLESGGTL